MAWLLTRRHALLGAAALLPLRGRAAPAAPLALHALNRLSYGPRPGELEALAAGFDWEAYVAGQLAVPAAAPPPPTPVRLSDYRRLQGQAPRDEAARAALRDWVQAAQQAAAAARLRPALASDAGLTERLVEFWANHFNVFGGKGPCRVLMADYEARAIRPHVLGRFRDLLGAVTRHPAMLVYLDNAQSRAGALNENHARELMELHTLGVDGGYTQADVQALARVLTGWTVDPRDGAYRFVAGRHDDGAKTWLGRPVSGRGEAQGDAVLDQLARHPRTAQRLAYKLAQFFVADAPDPTLVAATARAFLDSDGDLRATTGALLMHPAARAPAVHGAQFKTPYRFVLSLLRATGQTAPADLRPVQQALRELGQPLFGCVTPDGWKCTRDAWLDPEALARRADLAARWANRWADGMDASCLLATLGDGVSPRTRARLADEAPRWQAALLLGAPDFQNA